MPLCESLPTPEPVQGILMETVSLIEATDIMNHITELLPDIYELQWIPSFGELVTELATTMSKDAKEKLATAGVEIRRPLPGETGITPAVLLTNETMFTSNENRCFLLQRLPISDEIHQKIVQHIQTRFPKLGKIRSGPIADTELRLWSDTNRSERKEVKFPTNTVSLIYGGVGLRTEPPLSPFLMISLATQPRQNQQNMA